MYRYYRIYDQTYWKILAVLLGGMLGLGILICLA